MPFLWPPMVVPTTPLCVGWRGPSPLGSWWQMFPSPWAESPQGSLGLRGLRAPLVWSGWSRLPPMPVCPSSLPCVWGWAFSHVSYWAVSVLLMNQTLTTPWGKNSPPGMFDPSPTLDKIRDSGPWIIVLLILLGRSGAESSKSWLPWQQKAWSLWSWESSLSHSPPWRPKTLSDFSLYLVSKQFLSKQTNPSLLLYIKSSNRLSILGEIQNPLDMTEQLAAICPALSTGLDKTIYRDPFPSQPVCDSSVQYSLSFLWRESSFFIY